MTETVELRKLRSLAKRYARASCIALHEALDLIAGELDFSDWTKLIAASKKGWEAGDNGMAKAEALIARTFPIAALHRGAPEAIEQRLAFLDQSEQGTILGHTFRIEHILGDFLMAGEGWAIRIPENPGASPIVNYYTDRKEDCAVFNPAFLEAAKAMARSKASLAKADTAIEWPRRSTKPDHDGVVRHPLHHDDSNVWFCLSCEGRMTGPQIADNLWHCPGCGTLPIDIFSTAFWAEDRGASFAQVEIKPSVRAARPEVRIVDGRPRLEMTDEKVVLLIRSALIDEAANVSERLGAMLAQINVNDDEVWVTLNVDLWPEDKDAVEATAVAKLLGLRIELDCTEFKIPFAWPGLGELTTSTQKYVKTMLDAYARSGAGCTKSSEPT